MNKNLLKLPGGVKDSLPIEARQKRKMENELVDLFQNWGYQEVITPTFEFYHVIKDDDTIEDQLFKFIDREGKILALRSDITTPIARMIASHYTKNINPLRFFYIGNVYRYESTQTGRQREFVQAGVELIGAKGVDADSEVINLAIESLLACNLKDFKIGIGQAKITQGLIEKATEDVKIIKKIKLAIINKDFVGLENILNDANCSPEIKEKIIALVTLHGGKNVLEKAKKIMSDTEFVDAISDLEKVYENIENSGLEEYIFFDFSILRDFDYYTGIVFEGYAHGLGYPVLGGGRYDKLLGKFGEDRFATGFALGLERIMLAKNSTNNEYSLDYFLTNGEYDALNKKAIELRKAGYKVAVDLIGMSKSEAKEYAERMNIKEVLFLNGGR